MTCVFTLGFRVDASAWVEDDSRFFGANTVSVRKAHNDFGGRRTEDDDATTAL